MSKMIIHKFIKIKNTIPLHALKFNPMKTTKPLFLQFFISTVSAWLTYLAHEFFHWLAYTFFEIKTSFELNTIKVQDHSEIIPDSKLLIIYGSGVVFTFSQSLYCYLRLKKKESIWLTALLISAFELRLLAAILNFISPSDEGKISLILGVNQHTFSFLLLGGMGWFIYKLINGKKHTTKELTLIFLVVFISIYVFSRVKI